jgi:aspartate/methionine/tyrosine aminotransferase
LDRALCAVKLVSQGKGSPSARLVADQPCLDIGVAMAEMHYGLNTTVLSGPPSVHVRKCDQLTRAIALAAKRDPSSQIVALITSPDNPTGYVWSLDDIQTVADECRRVDAVLVADHSFALAGIHAPRDLPMVWDLPADSCGWFAIWDTGKTIDVSGHKVGFILSSDALLTQALDQSLYMIQFAPSQLSLSVFQALFSHDQFAAYVLSLGSACRNNLASLERGLPEGSLVVPPMGGSLAWIDLSSGLLSGEELSRDWQRRGVSSLSGRVFFAGSARPDVFLRVALARSEAYFEQALSLVQTARL